MTSTKEHILASAMRLLDAGGPSAVTLRAVGGAAGISATAPYRHYQDKRSLLEALVRANLDYLNAALQKAKAFPFGAFEHLMRANFDFARRFPFRYRFLLEVSHEDSPLGAKDGDAKHISALILGAAYGTATLSASNREGVVPALAPLLLDLLACRKKPGTPRLSIVRTMSPPSATSPSSTN